MTNLFKVEGQTLTPLAIYEAVSDTVNYLTFAFSFNSEWDGLTKSAIFTKGDDEYEVVLTSDAITADDHVNLSAGVWEISVVGDTVVDAVVTRQITSTSYNLTVIQSGAISGGVFPPSVASQVYINTNQATPQTIISGVPLLASTRTINADHQLVDKKYVDDHSADLTGVTLLDQTTPQEFINGIPTLEATRTINADHQIVDKAYVDTVLGDIETALDALLGV